MKILWVAILVLVATVTLAKSAHMLPPEIYREPLFVSGEGTSDDGDSEPREVTTFA